MEFSEALRYLLSLGHETLAIKLGLTNIALLLNQLGNPQRKYQSVQIAGTNGKGSTAVMLHSICNAAGIKTGLFTSPHLISITERIKIGRDDISEDFFARCATSVRNAVEELSGICAREENAEKRSVSRHYLEKGRPRSAPTFTAAPSFFEQVTAIALLAFAQSETELAILETGLGGRLDATTAVGSQIVGITQITIDHQEYLGETIEQIAGEKAAIIQSGVIAVVSPQDEAVMRVVRDRCERVGVEAGIDDCDSKVDGFTENGQAVVTYKTATDVYPGVRLGLAGLHQVTNASLAVRLAESLREKGFAIDRRHIIEGLEAAKHPGRLESFSTKPRLLLDGAHNAAGAAALRVYLDEFVHVPITLVFGAMRDKQLDQMARVLFPAAKRLVLTVPNSPRAASVETLRPLAEQFFPDNEIKIAASADEVLQTALAVTRENEMICVAGSLYLVGEIRELILRHDLPTIRVAVKRP